MFGCCITQTSAHRRLIAYSEQIKMIVLLQALWANRIDYSNWFMAYGPPRWRQLGPIADGCSVSLTSSQIVKPDKQTSRTSLLAPWLPCVWLRQISKSLIISPTQCIVVSLSFNLCNQSSAAGISHGNGSSFLDFRLLWVEVNGFIEWGVLLDPWTKFCSNKGSRVFTYFSGFCVF